MDKVANDSAQLQTTSSNSVGPRSNSESITNNQERSKSPQRTTEKRNFIAHFRAKAGRIFSSKSRSVGSSSYASTTLVEKATDSSAQTYITKDVPEELVELQQIYDEAYTKVDQFTPERIKRLKDSWVFIKHHMEQIGVVVFLGIFEEHSDFRDAFTQFRDRDLPELARDPALQMHGLRVLNIVDKFVSRLGNLESFESIVMSLGSRHCMYTTTIALFKYVGQQIFEAVQNTLTEKEKWTDELASDWKALTTYLSSAMVYALSTHVHSMKKSTESRTSLEGRRLRAANTINTTHPLVD